MPSTVLYEVRTIEKNKIDRKYAKNLSEVFSLIKSARSKRIHVYKLHKSPDGEVLRSEELDCKIKGRSLVVKTIKIKPFKKVPDRRASVFAKINLQDNSAILPISPRIKVDVSGRHAKALTRVETFRRHIQSQQSGVIIRRPILPSQRVTRPSERSRSKLQTYRPARSAADLGSRHTRTISAAQGASRAKETSHTVRHSAHHVSPRRAAPNRANQARPTTSRRGRRR